MRARRSQDSDLPAPGRPRNHEHDVRGREPVRRAARRRARRLPRRRWIVPSSTVPEVESAREHADDFLERAGVPRRPAPRSGRARRAFSDDGVDLAGYSLPERVDDLEAARRALGYAQIDLLSESAGTRTAMIYAWRYPSAHPPLGDDRRQPTGALPLGREDDRRADPPLRRALRGERDVHSRTPDLAASIHSAVRAPPGALLFLPIRKGNVEAATFFGLINATADGGGPIAAPKTIDTLLSAQQGDGSGAWFLSLMARARIPAALRSGARSPPPARATPPYATALLRASRRPRLDHRQPRHRSRSGSAGASSTPGPRIPTTPCTRASGLECRDAADRWALDFATPPQNATRELLPHLPNGHQVVLPDIGHSERLLGATSRGRQPPDQHVLRQRPRRHVALHARVASTSRRPSATARSPRSSSPCMLSFAALTVLSLLWLPLRVAPARTIRAEDAVSRCGRSTSSCSGSAAGSPAC